MCCVKYTVITRYYRTNTIKDIGKKTFLLLSGDFNAKVGQFTEGDNSIGKYSKGRRNENGKTLLELCESENLFITNSAFPHPSSHTTTWVGQRRDPHTKKIIPIYNQIDYIICHRRYKHLATNARSYGGTIVTSDHKLVITTFELEWFKVWRKRTTQSTPKINTSNIVHS